MSETYPYRVHADILTMYSEGSCNPVRFRIRGDALEVSGDGRAWQRLTRSQ